MSELIGGYAKETWFECCGADIMSDLTTGASSTEDTAAAWDALTAEVERLRAENEELKHDEPVKKAADRCSRLMAERDAALARVADLESDEFVSQTIRSNVRLSIERDAARGVAFERQEQIEALEDRLSELTKRFEYLRDEHELQATKAEAALRGAIEWMQEDGCDCGVPPDDQCALCKALAAIGGNK